MIAASARRLDGARHRLTARRELAQLRGQLPALLAGTPAEGRLDDARGAQWTRSGVAVYVLESPRMRQRSSSKPPGSRARQPPGAPARDARAVARHRRAWRLARVAAAPVGAA